MRETHNGSPSSISITPMKRTNTGTRRLLAGLLGGAAIILAVATFAVLLSKPEKTVGDVQSVEQLLTSDSQSEVTTSVATIPIETAEEPLANTGSAILPNEASLLEALDPGTGPVPVGLVIESIDVDAPVIQQGIDVRTGQMEVPSNVSDVAWYEYGPTPGESGSAVLAAHVDLEGQGPGVFFDLRTLEPGDLIEVLYENGTSEEFRVEARTIYDKDELPLESIFSREGPPVLTLITCGGGFNPALRNYDSNVVVYALPVTPVVPPSEVA